MLRALKIFMAAAAFLFVSGAQSVAQIPSDANLADYGRSIASLRNEVTELQRKFQKSPKDVWDKVSSISGLASGVAVALIGFYATNIYRRRELSAEEHRKELNSSLELAKFSYQKEIEQLKFGYEQEKWQEVLSSQVALKLFDTRLAEYSDLWSRIQAVAFSHQESKDLTRNCARELASEVRNWRYSKGGLLAEPTTRDAAYAFQQAVWDYDETSEGYRRIRVARRILRDALRADIGISENMFGKSL